MHPFLKAFHPWFTLFTACTFYFTLFCFEFCASINTDVKIASHPEFSLKLNYSVGLAAMYGSRNCHMIPSILNVLRLNIPKSNVQYNEKKNLILFFENVISVAKSITKLAYITI